MTKICQVDFHTYQTSSGHYIARATLNAEVSLNALTLEMIEGLDEQLQSWLSDPVVVAIVLDGAGEKAFCAGGDVRRLYKSVIDSDHGSNPYAETFFTREYCLDYRIHTSPKPIICWGAGIVMGGGIGLMAGASHRIVTSSSRLAMPEISIGLFPDVGGSWILGRMPGRTGLFLGLTGARIHAADALFVGLADRMLEDGTLEDLLLAMQAESWSSSETDNHRQVSQILRDLERHQDVTPSESHLLRSFAEIQQVTDADSPVEMLVNLRRLEGSYWQRAADTLEKGCPLTAWLVFEQIRRARHNSLADVFRQELNMAVHCLRGRNLAEGVRALLLEKGTDPIWIPSGMDQVSAETIDSYFESLWPEGEHPLSDL